MNKNCINCITGKREQGSLLCVHCKYHQPKTLKTEQLEEGFEHSVNVHKLALPVDTAIRLKLLGWLD